MRARALLDVLRSQARRAFVLELTGTPKAGKSTSVTTLETFFREAGYQVHLLKERAADCPLPMKGHFFFNAWTAATMLAEVLETHEANVDLLILDRGFFDALVWLELQARREQVTDEEKRVFSEFILLDRWRKLVDATVIMKVEPEQALKREHQNQILPRPGSMMNPSALGQFNNALGAVVSEHGSAFHLFEIDTTQTEGVRETNVNLLRDVLPLIEGWADPSIAVVPRTVLTTAFDERPFITGDEAVTVLRNLRPHVRTMRRSEAEKDPGVVQFMAAGIHTHRDRVLVLERELLDKKSSDYGRHKLWVGRHVETSDPLNEDVLDAGRRGLIERIKDDLHLASDLQPVLLGLAWNVRHGSEHETQHVGIMYRVPIVNELVAKHLQNKKFKKMARSRRLSSSFMTQEEILTSRDLDLEPWSKHAVENLPLPAEDA